MLLISLVASLLCFLVCSNAMSHKKRSAFGASLLCAFIAFFGPMFLGMISLPTLAIAVVLFFMMHFWSHAPWSVRSFRYGSILAFFLIYGGCSFQAYRELSDLKREYAVVQLHERLPKKNSTSENVELSERARAQLNDLEEKFADATRDGYQIRRVQQEVQSLHENALLAFTMSPSFGVARMSTTFSILQRNSYKPDTRTMQQGTLLSWTGLSISEVDALPESSFQSFERWLTASIMKFVPFWSLGVALESNRIAGFHSHGMEDYSKVPEKSHSLVLDYAKYQVNRLDLISLLLHEKPVAYVSDTLPNMANLSKLRTRPLNPFEAVGLLRLEAGESIYVKEYQEHTLVLGALRNAKQCQACHEGERGKLLGAFSYDLVRTK